MTWRSILFNRMTESFAGNGDWFKSRRRLYLLRGEIWQRMNYPTPTGLCPKPSSAPDCAIQGAVVIRASIELPQAAVHELCKDRHVLLLRPFGLVEGMPFVFQLGHDFWQGGVFHLLHRQAVRLEWAVVAQVIGDDVA